VATTTTNSAHPVDSISGNTLKNIGTIVTILALLASMALGYGRLQQRLDDACARLEKVEAKVEAFQLSDTETKVQLSRIETDLAYIRAWIEKQDRLD